ncbi:MAG: hypothetical protein ACT4PM_01945 [Gemmatimonadales bacterium]
MRRAGWGALMLGLGWLGAGAGAGFAQEPFPSLEWLARTRSWRWTSGVGLGIIGRSGEIGRDRNATGGQEELVASLGTGIGIGARTGYESRFGGLELRGTFFSSAVQVVNEDEVRFPNHGKRPFAWTGSALVYPVSPLQRRPGAVRPFLAVGVGGIFLSVDLDNIEDQTLYHSFLWSLSGGLRIATDPEDVPSVTPTHVELRVERTRVWGNHPLGSFQFWVVTAGLGMKW